MNTYHVQRSELILMEPPYMFRNGNIYVVEDNSNFWIWIGSKASVDLNSVEIWGLKTLEVMDKNLSINIVKEGEEPSEFKSILEYDIEETNEPNFLKIFQKKIDCDYHQYKIKEDEKNEIKLVEVAVDYNAFNPTEAFVIDGEKEVYIWTGRKSVLNEQLDTIKIMNLLKVETRPPTILYKIKQEDEPEGFSEFITKIATHRNVREIRNLMQIKREEPQEEDKSKKKKRKGLFAK